MVEQRSRELGLLLQNVSGNEAAKIAAFLKLGADRLRHTWKIVSNEQPRVLLCGSDFFDTLPGELEGPVTALRLVDDAENDDADATCGVLSRPLQYDDFIGALAAAEPKMGSNRLAAPSEASPDAVAAGSAAKVTASQALASPQGAAPTAGPNASADLPASLFQVEHYNSFRLRRWPEAALLSGHRYHVRLASFLSTRHLSVAELARFSNVSPEDCARFLQRLGDVGLLDARVSTPTPPTPTDPSALCAEAAAAAPAASLFSRLRRRLGME